MAKKRGRKANPDGTPKKRTKKKGGKRKGGAGNAALARKVETLAKGQRHHASFLRAITNNLRRTAGESALKDPLAKPAASVVPRGVLGRARARRKKK